MGQEGNAISRSVRTRIPVEDKLWIVLSVLRGEMSVSEAARRLGRERGRGVEMEASVPGGGCESSRTASEWAGCSPRRGGGAAVADRERTTQARAGRDDGAVADPVARFEPIAAEFAEAWPAWGHRKIAALMRADGYEVSTSTVERALRCRGDHDCGATTH